ncbi:MAG: hypothetical protein AAF960_13305 [Bacteroidota bacterium]
MKKLTLWLVFTSLSFYLLSAQTSLASFEPIAAKPKIAALQSNTNAANILGISYAFNGSLYWNALNDSGEVVEKKKLRLDGTRVRPRGTVYAANQFFHFYENTDNHTMLVIEASDSGRESKLAKQQLLQKKENFIAHLADKNEFYALALHRKSKTLRVFRFNPTTQTFDVKEILLKDYLVDKLHKVKFRPIAQVKNLMPHEAATPLKGYLLATDKILLTIDGAKARGQGPTELLAIDWEAGTLENRIMGENGFALDDHSKSFVFQDRIFRIIATKERLTLRAYNLNDLEKIQEFHYTPKTPIDIMDSPFHTESSGNDGFYLFDPSRNAKDLEKDQAKKILKKLAVGAPFVLPESNGEGELLLTVGTHIATNGGGGMFMPGTPGTTISTPGGPVAMPGSPGMFVGGGGSYRLSRFFYTRLNATNLSHLSTDDSEESGVNPIRQFIDETLTAKHVYALTPYGDKTAIVHYLRSDKRIKVDLF